MSRTSSMSQGIAGVRAKRFLAKAVYELASEISRKVPDAQKELREIVSTAIKASFEFSPEQALTSQTNSFLQWLGFSPVDVEWDEDQRKGVVLIGTSRMWKGNILEDEVLQIIVLAIIEGLSRLFLRASAKVEIDRKMELPPRYKVCIRFSSRYDVDVEKIAIPRKGVKAAPTTATKSGVFNVLGQDLVTPIIGRRIGKDEAIEALVKSSWDYIQEKRPDLIERHEEDLELNPVYILWVTFEMAMADGLIKQVAADIGAGFHSLLRDPRPTAKPSDLLRGVGLLPIEEEEELMFTSPNRICQHSHEDFCKFLTHIWARYASLALDREVVADPPSCASGASSLCIYTFKLIKV